MQGHEWTPWTDALMACLELMGITLNSTFVLDEVYRSEDVLKLIYPKNNNIRDKIRQQLQVLRENGIIVFIDGNGTYKRVE